MPQNLLSTKQKPCLVLSKAQNCSKNLFGQTIATEVFVGNVFRRDFWIVAREVTRQTPTKETVACVNFFTETRTLSVIFVHRYILRDLSSFYHLLTFGVTLSFFSHQVSQHNSLLRWAYEMGVFLRIKNVVQQTLQQDRRTKLFPFCLLRRQCFELQRTWRRG